MASLAVTAEENSGPSQESVAQLFLRLRPRLRALLADHRIPPADANDLLHEAFVYLLLRPEPPRNPKAWLVGTLRHRCYHYWRQRRSARTPQPLDPDDLVELAGQDSDTPEGRIDAIAIREALARLSARDRELVHLRFVLECSGDEIGRLFDLSPASARKITLRALERLRRLLSDPEYEPQNVTSAPAGA